MSVSAGFDAADGDELGQCKVSPAGFSHMTHLLSSLADGKVVLALEGGYCIEAIANSALACTQTLLGEPLQRLDPMTASKSATEVVALVSREQSRHWKSIRPLRERREGGVWRFGSLAIAFLTTLQSTLTTPSLCRSPVRSFRPL